MIDYILYALATGGALTLIGICYVVYKLARICIANVRLGMAMERERQFALHRDDLNRDDVLNRAQDRWSDPAYSTPLEDIRRLHDEFEASQRDHKKRYTVDPESEPSDFFDEHREIEL